MCHPGFVDAALKASISLTTLREHEFAYSIPMISAALAKHGVALARPAGNGGAAA